MWQGHAHIYLSLEHKLEMEENGGLVIKKHKLQDSCCLTAFLLSLSLSSSQYVSASLSLSTSLRLDLGLLSASVGVWGSECVAVMLSGDRGSA